MKNRFQIGEIAQFFHLPASTLRYWEDCGILTPEKNEENQYRAYTVPDLMTISDIIFYKSLGISLKDIRGIDKHTPSQQKQLFDEKMQELMEEQEQLQRRMEKMRRHITAVQTLEDLKRTAYQETDIDTDCIVSFDLIERDKLRRYIENPYLYSRVQHSDCLQEEQRGLTIPAHQACQFPSSQILWRKNSSTYLVCLMKEQVCAGFPNDLDQHLAHIQKTYRTGTVISRFLLCAQEDGKVYDYYKTFVEVFR